MTKLVVCDGNGAAYPVEAGSESVMLTKAQARALAVPLMSDEDDNFGGKTFPSLAGRRVVITDAAIEEDKGFFMCTPDAFKMETVNRISANNGTWTADRSGFVQCIVKTSNATAIIFWLDDKSYLRNPIPSGTNETKMIIPVNKGDIVKITAEANFVSCVCYYIPPKWERIMNGNVGTYVNEMAGTMAVPDMDKIETVNRISANNGTWTADRSGFVIGTIQYSASNSLDDNASILINSKSYYSAGIKNTGGFISRVVVPVAIGDTVQLRSANNLASSFNCYFIPPKVVTLDGDVLPFGYSTSEQKTLQRWINGKPIYRKTVQWARPAMTANTWNVIGTLSSMLPADTEALVDSRTTDSSGSNINWYSWSMVNPSGSLAANVPLGLSAGGINTTTFYYTKSSD